MARHQKNRRHAKAKTILQLPDLEQSRNAVLNSLGAASSQEPCGHAIDEFTGWYARNPDSRSTGRLYFRTASSWNKTSYGSL